MVRSTARPIQRKVLLLDLEPNLGLRERLPGFLPNGERIVEPRADGGAPSRGELDRLLAGARPAAAVVTSSLAARRRTEDLVRALRQRSPLVPIFLAAQTMAADDVLRLLRIGVDDYATPPLTETELRPRLARILGPDEPQAANRPERVEIEGLLGCSPAFHKMVEELHALARCDATVLIEGETGTGKELCSRAIHRLSARTGRPFCSVNCGAMPRELVENELFGHRRAAFTGASVDQVGLISAAEGGTLLFDEIDCLPAGAQASLLRFVQNAEYRPLGSPRLRRADVRLVATTNAELAQAVERGKFRQDLYYRLDVLRLRVPTLRERREDVLLLARHFLARYAEKYRSEARRFSREAIAAMLRHDWPGNVRELENAVERAVALGLRSRVLTADHLRLNGCSDPPPTELFREAKRRLVAEFERSYLSAYLAAFDGNIARAAHAAGKNRRAFFELMRKHSIDAAEFKA